MATSSVESRFLRDSVGEGKRFVLARPFLSAGVLLGTSVLSLGHLAESMPQLAWLVSGPFFPYFHETHDVLAIFLAIYAAYRWLPALGLASALLFLALHVPYFFLEFQPPEVLRIAYGSIGATLAIWLIDERRRAMALLKRRYSELLAVNRITQEVLTERAHLSTELDEARRHLGRLLHASQSAVERLPPGELCAGILGLALETTGLDAGEIWLLDPGRQELRLICREGLTAEVLLEGTRLRIGEALPGIAVQRRLPMFRSDGDSEAGPWHPAAGPSALTTIGAVPLFCGEEVIGALTVAGRGFRELSAAEVDWLVSLAKAVAPLLKPLMDTGG